MNPILNYTPNPNVPQPIDFRRPNPIINTGITPTPVTTNITGSEAFAPWKLSNNNGVNWGDSSFMSQYGIPDYKSQFEYTPVEKTSWLGNTTRQDVFNSQATFDNLNKNPMFASYIQNQPASKAEFIKANLNNLDLSNMNTFDTQVNQLMSQQKNNAWTPQNTLSAVQTGMGAITSLANLYYGFKQQKLAERNLDETLALQRANYRNQARAMNAQYRDQMSGRGTTVMSGSSKRKLGEMYANRRVSETY